MKFAPSANMSSKEFLFTMGALAIVVSYDTVAPLMVLTVPQTILNTSSHMASNWVSEHDGTAFGSLGGLQGFVNFLWPSAVSQQEPISI